MPSKLPIFPLRLEPELKARAQALVARYPGETLNGWISMIVKYHVNRLEADLNTQALERGEAPAVVKVVESKKAAPAAPKVSRNSPCSCGSGKKFKRCCGR